MSDNKNYPVALEKEMSLFFNLLNERNNHVNRLKNSNSDLWETILFKLKVDWTYNYKSPYFILGLGLDKADSIRSFAEELSVSI